MPPKDMYDGVNLWFLLKAMNGTREASRQWGLYIKDSMVPASFIGSAAIPVLHYHTEWNIMIACHGDDFLAECLSEGLDRLDELMKEKFEVKILSRIGDPDHGGPQWRGSVRRNTPPQNHQVEPSRFQLGSRSQVCRAIGKGHGTRQSQKELKPQHLRRLGRIEGTLTVC